MRTLGLAFRYLWSRPLAAVLNLCLLTLGLASITFVVVVSHQVNHAFERDLAGIDAVVGAKGSPLQLIMAGVFHIDVPAGNVPLSEVRKLAQQPNVGEVIPLALGDSFRGHRIVGTTERYVAHYKARVAQGALWNSPMDAVAGAYVARTTGLRPGSTFAGGHGLAAGGPEHASQYSVTGVLAPCNCVLDRLILTSLESVWHVHEKHETPDKHEPGPAAQEEERDVTLALVTYKSPLAAAAFPRYVNTRTGMQAAAPAVEVTRLLRLLGAGTEVMQGLGAVLLLTAALSVFIALWNAVRERREDLAMLRMLGAGPVKVAALLLCEALWLAVLATALGLAAGHLLAALTGQLLEAQQSLAISGWQWAPAEAWIPVAAVGVATAAALIPAAMAYRLDVAQLLHRR